AHGGKNFRVFAQALGFEHPAREAAAGEVSIAAVNLAEPTFVFPGAAADVNVLGRQCAELAGETGAVECIRIFEERSYHAWDERKKKGSAPASITPLGVSRISTGAAPLWNRLRTSSACFRFCSSAITAAGMRSSSSSVPGLMA